MMSARDLDKANGVGEVLGIQTNSNFSTAEEMAVFEIRKAIFNSNLRPGTKLVQEELATALGISRVPIRAALRQLEAEGLVKFRRNKGAIVAKLELSDLDELYELRLLLEVYLLDAVFANVSQDQVEVLDSIASRLDEEKNAEEWLRLRHEFYETLYEMADRPRTAALVRSLRGLVGRYWVDRRVLHDDSAHAVIVHAMQTGNLTAAKESLSAHLKAVARELHRLVSESEKIEG